MSNRRRLRSRDAAEVYATAEPIWLTQFGVCATEADIEETRRQTHDFVIQMAGERRLTGVTWYTWDASEAAEVLESVHGTRKPDEIVGEYPDGRTATVADELDSDRAMLDKLDEWGGGYLVMAYVEVVPPAHLVAAPV